MSQLKIPAVFMRGGTSKALFFRDEDLPADRAARERIFLAALGSPDPNGRQLDGMGGGYSSVSKIAVIGAPSRTDVAVDYTFAQVDVGTARVDWRGNCGNISSAVPLYAAEEGLADGPSVRFLNTNTDKVVEATLDGEPYELPGVAGLAPRISLAFLDPGGAATGKLLPTGLTREEIGGAEASLVDATNPMVFVRASDLAMRGDETPDVLDSTPGLHDRLEEIRVEAAVRMGMAATRAEATERIPAVPKIAMLARGEDLVVRLVSMGKFHRAVALTGAMCLAVAAHIPGTIARELSGDLSPGADVRIRHPAGVLPIAAKVCDGRAESVIVYRTARRLMEGFVRIPESVLA